jgi:hypothetical protein
MDKKFYEASKIVRWAVLIYDSQRNFPQPAYAGLVSGFLNACDDVGQFFNLNVLLSRFLIEVYILFDYRHSGGKS